MVLYRTIAAALVGCAVFLLTSPATATSSTTISGPITNITSSKIVINSGYPHGYVPVVDSHATITGEITLGAIAEVTGYFNSFGQMVASSVVTTPQHVKVWTYYGELGIATNVPASWMAANATFVVGPPNKVTAFHYAGGHYGVSYVDPIDVIPANHEPMWNVPESGWFHRNGRRIFRHMGGSTQNSLNPSSGWTRSSFTTLTSSIRASSPGYNLIEVDNVDWDLTSAWWNFNAFGVEIATNLAYDVGIEGLLRSSSLPTIFNGLHDNAGGLAVSGDTVFLPYSTGGLSENCMQDVLGPLTGSAWLFSENTMLATTSLKKWAICEGQSSSSDNRLDRTYFLASWWLTYDPSYSVAFPRFASNGSVFLFPEYRIVPTQPIATAHTNVSTLLTATGAYARQFAQCYQGSVSIGGCVAIVNPSSTRSVSMPLLARNYHHVLQLDTRNSYYGGGVTWSTAMPSFLPPKRATVLKT